MSLSLSTRDFRSWVDKEAQDFVLKLTYKVWNGIITLTPVLTGQARASWNMSKEKPNYTTVDDGDNLPPPVAPKLEFKKGEYPLIFIANGKPYINLLEHGYSAKAPAGMVQVTLDSLNL